MYGLHGNHVETPAMGPMDHGKDGAVDNRSGSLAGANTGSLCKALRAGYRFQV